MCALSKSVAPRLNNVWTLLKRSASVHRDNLALNSVKRRGTIAELVNCFLIALE